MWDRACCIVWLGRISKKMIERDRSLIQEWVSIVIIQICLLRIGALLMSQEVKQLSAHVRSWVSILNDDPWAEFIWKVTHQCIVVINIVSAGEERATEPTTVLWMRADKLLLMLEPIFSILSTDLSWLGERIGFKELTHGIGSRGIWILLIIAILIQNRCVNDLVQSTWRANLLLMWLQLLHSWVLTVDRRRLVWLLCLRALMDASHLLSLHDF